MTKLNTLLAAAVVAAATLTGVSAAHAAPFGPATAALGSFSNPTVNLSTMTITLNGGTRDLTSGTGTLSGFTDYLGTGAGSFTYGALGATVGDVVASLFSFNDNVGGSYVYDLASVALTSFVNNPGVTTTLGFYLLGSMYDTNLGLTTTATSLSFTVNSTGGSAFSESGSLANPPTPPPSVPEPASMLILGAGLAALGLVRRNKA